MKTIMLSILSVSLAFTLSCAGASKPSEAPATTNAEPSAATAQTPPPNIKAQPIAPPPASIPTPEPAVTKTPAEPAKAEPKEVMWTMKSGKLHGPGALVPSKKISTVKNQKTPGTTSEFCYNYGKFAIVEVVSTDEKGALDLFVRFPSDKAKNLCSPDFGGKYAGMDVLEGSFAGVAGDHIVVDGIDSSEGLTEFQIFNLETGKETFRGAHHPTEEFAITKNGEKTGLVYFAKVKVPCEMGTDPKGCWPKVLAENKLKKAFPAPDCAAAFKKANTPMDELALITVRARVANIKEPKVELLGTRATCAPAP